MANAKHTSLAILIGNLLLYPLFFVLFNVDLLINTLFILFLIRFYDLLAFVVGTIPLLCFPNAFVIITTANLEYFVS